MKIEKINDMLGHEGAIYALEESFEPNKCYSAGFDNIVVEWNLELETNPIGIAKLPSKAFSILKIEPLGLLLVGTAQGGVHVIDIKTKQEIKFLFVQSDMIFDLLFISEKQQLVVVSADGTMAIWNTTDWSLIDQQKLSHKKLRCVLHLNQQLLVGCEDGTIKILDDSTYEEVGLINAHDSDFGVNTLVVSPNHKFILSGSRDGHINVHSIANKFELLKRIPAHNFAVYDIKYSPDQSMFISVSRDKSFKIWDAQSYKVLKKVDFKNGGHKASVNAVLWTQNNQVVTTGDDRSIKVWEITK